MFGELDWGQVHCLIVFIIAKLNKNGTVTVIFNKDLDPDPDAQKWPPPKKKNFHGMGVEDIEVLAQFFINIFFPSAEKICLLVAIKILDPDPDADSINVNPNHYILIF